MVGTLVLATAATGLLVQPNEPAAEAAIRSSFTRSSVTNSTATESTPYGIWSDATVPRITADPETRSVTLGVQFTSSTDGWVSAIRFYRSAANRGPHEGTLWSSDGKVLARAAFPSSTSVGWQTATLASPVRVSKHSVYTASYRATRGRYAGDTGALSSRRPVTTGALTARRGVYTYGQGIPTSTWRNSNYYVDVLFSPTNPAGTTPPVAPPPVTTAPPVTTTPPVTTAPPVTTPPTTTPPTTTAPTTTPPTTTAPPVTSPPPGGFPSAATTGVPAGTVLSAYSGPCTITVAGTVIDAKRIGCSLEIRAANVVVTRSVISGTIATGENSSGFSFRIADSEVNVGNREGTGIGAVNFTATRVHVTGGNRSIHCYNSCVVEDSYVHGQFRDDTGRVHESGIRMGQNAVIRRNTIVCDAPNVPPDAGCSAGLTGYGDFAPVRNNVIEGNFFGATTGGFCAYGGSSAGKPFSSQTRDIVFRNNVFERGPNGKCGYWGPITSFDSRLPGNVWSNNTWSNGGTVAPAN